MLRLPAFQYLSPKTLAEAVSLKSEHGSQAMYVAGGTDLFPKMKRRQMEPHILIGLNQIEKLRQFHNGHGCSIGAGLTLAEVAAQPQIQQQYPALAKAAGLVSSPPLRNAGTIGGNLCVDTRCTYYDQTFQWRQALGFCMKKDGDICWVAKSSTKCLAVCSSDTAPVVIALAGTVRLMGPDGERTIPAQALYQNDGQFYLAKSPDEILTAIQLPARDGWRMAYWKLRRRASIDFPILGVAVALKLDEEGRCVQARVVLGAVASQPIIVGPQAISQLLGKVLNQTLIDEFSQQAYALAKPLDNTDMALSYRKKLTRIYIAGALKEAAGIS